MASRTPKENDLSQLPPPKVDPEKAARKTLVISGKVEDRERILADLAVEGVFGNAALMRSFGERVVGEVGITEAVLSLRRTIDTVRGGDLGSVEALLVSQAASLNAIFGELVRRSGMNMGEHLDATDRYMRLALKAQAQCRATLETLAAIKNPPVVFARQANINNGGQQQVNNAPLSSAPAPAENPPTELLERGDGQRMDARAASTSSRGDPQLVPVGGLDRASKR